MDALTKLVEKWEAHNKLNELEYMARQWNLDCQICQKKSDFPHCFPSCESRCKP